MFPWQPRASQARDVGEFAATGAQWIRMDLQWNVVQAKGPTDWTWDHYDQMAQLAERNGFHVLFVVTWTPKWANGGANQYTPPTNPNDYARFFAWAVARYKPGGAAGTNVRAWEIWNEPNSPQFWVGPANAWNYTQLLRAAYAAGKPVDPGATIVTGGLAPDGDLNKNPTNPRHPLNYLLGMYFSGAKGYFDAVGHHPYAPVPYSPLKGGASALGWNSFQYTKRINAIMKSFGDGKKKIWGTETGAATGKCAGCVSEATQSKWLRAEYQRWVSWSFTGPLFWHAGRDDKTGGPAKDQNYGLLHSDFTPKPAYATASEIW